MSDSPIVDDREFDPTPDELRQEAEAARESAKLAIEADDLAEGACDALEALTDHEGVSEKCQHQFGLLRRMVGSIRHGERWGYDSFYLQDYADKLEWRADRIEEAKDG